MFQPADQGRLVHPRLPWHPAVVDSNGKLLAWYHPERHLGYDRVLHLGWRFMEERVPVDPRVGLPVHLSYAVYDRRTLQGAYWQHNPAFLYAAFVDSVVAWYPYSGDRAAIRVVRTMLDYQLAHGTTPASWSWSSVPFSTACAGDRIYGRCLAGQPRTFYGGLEPDKVGLLGLGYLRFYELTGAPRYLTAARRSADALARHVRAGDATHTPWPFRVNGRTGAVLGRAEYGGAVVAPIELLGQLVRLGVGPTAKYRRARDIAWRWVLRFPLNPASSAFDRWGSFYEDTRYSPFNRNQLTPTLTARYLLTGGSQAPDADDQAQGLLQRVRTRLGRGPFLGAWGIDEQRTPGGTGCCSSAGLGSDTSRWAAVGALLYARSHDPDLREDVFRSLNYATYFARGDGRISCCGVRDGNEYWFSDGYADYLRSFNWAMAAIPDLAPTRQAHLLGSSSVVRSVSYGRRRITYRTFDRHATDVLRLPYRPRTVLAGSRALAQEDAPDEGYSVRPLDGGDYEVRVRHEASRLVRIVGR